MWFGTFGGLSRWDGESFRTFRPTPGEPGLAGSAVFSLLEGAGCIWIGTDGGGHARFDLATEKMTTWRAAPLDAGKLSSDRVLALAKDRRG
jgi:ligand-binding sensor domain-containing protein